MKKTIMFLSIAILLIIAYFIIFQSLTIGKVTIQSIGEIKNLDEKLKDKISIATEKTAKDYPKEVQNLNSATKELLTAKSDYEKVNKSGELGIIQIKTYKIEYLWTTLGNYAKKRNVNATFDILKNDQTNSYDISFKIIGDYQDIVDYISDVERDDSFSFKIAEFQLIPDTNIYTTKFEKYNTSTSETTTEKNKTTEVTQELPYEGIKTNTETTDTTVTSEYDPINLVATFKVKNIGIELD